MKDLQHLQDYDLHQKVRINIKSKVLNVLIPLFLNDGDVRRSYKILFSNGSNVSTKMFLKDAANNNNNRHYFLPFQSILFLL